MSTYKRVTQFHQVFNHPISKVPTAQTAEWRRLRARMLLEEMGEVLQELGFDARLEVAGQEIAIELHQRKTDQQIDLVRVAKELSDVDYVLQGTNVGMGLPSEAVAELTHGSNMSKAGPDGKAIYREDGKVLKGPSYYKAEPLIARVLEICSDNPKHDMTTKPVNVILQYCPASEVAHHAV